MPGDTYTCFEKLAARQAAGKDFLIAIQDVGASVTIMAPHGGRIEPRTSDLAKKIAKNDYNYYCFEGLKKENNGILHITSHRFDEPSALRLLAASEVVVAVHACTGTEGRVHLGGLDRALRERIASALEAAGIDVSNRHPRFKGSHPRNICNRGKRKKGVQLEVTRDLRDDLDKVEMISDAVRTALETI